MAVPKRKLRIQPSLVLKELFNYELPCCCVKLRVIILANGALEFITKIVQQPMPIYVLHQHSEAQNG